MKKYCDKCKKTFGLDKFFCPICGCRLKFVDDEVIEGTADIDIDIGAKILIINGKEMMYLGEENVDLSDPKYLALTVSKFKNDRRITTGHVTIIDPLDNLREYKCEIRFTPNLQIRGPKSGKEELLGFYDAHIQIPGGSLKQRVKHVVGNPFISMIDIYYEKYIMGDKILIFMDPNNNRRIFLLYVKKEEMIEEA